MKRLLITALLLILLTGCGYKGGAGFNNWSTYDKVVTAATIVTKVIDIGQTRHIYNNPNYYEKNPIIDTWFNSKNKSSAYIVGTEALVLIGVDYVSPSWRSALLTGNFITSTVCVLHNNQIGIKWEW